MVDYSDISNGNSTSSDDASADLFDRLGVSPIVSSESAKDAEGTLIRPSGCNQTDINIVIILNGFGSGSSDNLDSVSNSEAFPSAVNNEEINQIFRAAQHFTHSDGTAAVEERKKNQILMDYIASLGRSMEDVNRFALGATSSSPMATDNNKFAALKGSVASGLQPFLGDFAESDPIAVLGFTFPNWKLLASRNQVANILIKQPKLQIFGTDEGFSEPFFNQLKRRS